MTIAGKINVLSSPRRWPWCWRSPVHGFREYQFALDRVVDLALAEAAGQNGASRSTCTGARTPACSGRWRRFWRCRPLIPRSPATGWARTLARREDSNGSGASQPPSSCCAAMWRRRSPPAGAGRGAGAGGYRSVGRLAIHRPAHVPDAAGVHRRQSRPARTDPAGFLRGPGRPRGKCQPAGDRLPAAGNIPGRPARGYLARRAKGVHGRPRPVCPVCTGGGLVTRRITRDLARLSRLPTRRPQASWRRRWIWAPAASSRTSPMSSTA